MKRGATGVEIRETSIRIKIALGNGEVLRETLMVNGKPMKPTAPNQRYANRLADEIRGRILAGTFNYSEYFGPAAGRGDSGPSVASHLDTWLSTKRVKQSTKAGYETAVRFWKRACYKEDSDAEFGDLGLRAVLHSHVLTVLALQDDLNNKSLNNYLSIGRQAFALAKRDRLIDDNPFDGVKSARWAQPAPDPFDVDEIEAICADALKHYPGHVHNMIEFWFFTGCRTGEVLGLRWSTGVDLSKRYVHIHQSLIRGHTETSTKTGIERDVMLNSRSFAALQRQRALTQLKGDFVWTDPRDGSPWNDERRFRRDYWVPILKRLGIRYRRPYNMRHSWASMNLMAGNRPAWCAGQLGHSVKMFFDVYAKWIPGARDEGQILGLEKFLQDGKHSAQNS